MAILQGLTRPEPIAGIAVLSGYLPLQWKITKVRSILLRLSQDCWLADQSVQRHTTPLTLALNPARHPAYARTRKGFAGLLGSRNRRSDHQVSGNITAFVSLGGLLASSLTCFVSRLVCRFDVGKGAADTLVEAGMNKIDFHAYDGMFLSMCTYMPTRAELYCGCFRCR